jgi:hypothetical protein
MFFSRFFDRSWEFITAISCIEVFEPHEKNKKKKRIWSSSLSLFEEEHHTHGGILLIMPVII